ncbi:YfhO family protein [bacterium]|nr:YfhO family protein [bacterium]
MAKRSKKSKKQNVMPVSVEQAPSGLPFWQKHAGILTLGIIFILLLAYFEPVMFSNRTFQPPDSMTAKSYEPFIQGALDEGTFPLWNPYIFSGMPSFASLSSAPYADAIGDVINGFIWLFGKVIPLTDFTRLFINYLLLAVMMVLFMRSRNTSSMAALFAGIAIVMMPEFISYTAFGHHTKLTSAVLIPVVFLLVERLLDKRNLLFFSLTGLAIGLQLLRAHLQICYYTYIMLAIYVIYWLVVQFKEKNDFRKILGSIGLLGGAAILGLLISSVLYMSVWEYSHYSIRGGGMSGGLDFSYATNWSFPPSEMLTFVVPSFMGYGGDTYWGQIYFTDYPLYFSLVVMILAGLAFIVNRNRMVRYFGWLAAVALLISFGKHLPVLYGPLFKFLPFFNKFRTPKMIHILFDFSMVVLAGFGLDGLIRLSRDELERKSKAIERYLWIAGGIVILIGLLSLSQELYSGWVRSFMQAKYPGADPRAFNSIAVRAREMAQKDAVKAFFLFLFTGGAIWLTLKRLISRNVLSVALCILMILDLWVVDKKMAHPRSKITQANYFRETPEISYLKSQEEPFRILTVFDAYQRSPNWYMYHRIQNVFGYSAAKIKIYQELMEAFNMPEAYGNKYIRTVDGKTDLRPADEVNDAARRIHHTFLKLLNVKYVICQVPLPEPSLQLVHVPPQQARGGNCILRFDEALPRIFFPEKVVHFKEPDEILGIMAGGHFDPAETAIVEADPPFQIQPSENNRAKLTNHDIHRIGIEADIETACCMVLSEIYYPAGWKAYVDGRETTIYKTDYVLRSVFLEPGHHDIEFVFAPATFKTGLIISLGAFILLILGTVAGYGFGRRKRQTDINKLPEMSSK